MAESLGEKTEDATPKKIERARERGQVARSQDLSGAVGLAVGVLVLLAYGNVVLERFAVMIRRVLENEIAGDPLSGVDPMASFIESMTLVVTLVAPVLVVTFIGAYVIQYVQVGWLMTAKPLQPDLNKLSPIKGFKRLFDTKNMVKSIVNVFKLAAAIGLTWAVVALRVERLAALPTLDVWAAAWLVGVTVFELAAVLLLLLLVLGIIDLLYQRWQYKKDQRMTKQEVKDERRSMEGDVELKRRRSTMYAEIVRQQIRSGTPTADVIVTNPTHYSVGIRYEAETMRAPVVVARGADLLAFQIRQIADMHGIPIVERAPLARALYHGTEVGQEIAPEHYAAVAEVLAYVYRLNERAGRREGAA